MITKQIFSEGYAVILALGEDYINRLPKDVFEFIKSNSSQSDMPAIDENKALDEQGLSKEALAMLAMLKLEYWCDSAEEKSELLRYLETNEEKIKETLMATTSTRELLRLIKQNR